jgi:F0F1-type ATP synthase membrane subunit c/vacuolar-type H+-ATPase subunit K
VAINKSRYYKRDDGLAIGTGAFVAALGKRRLFLHMLEAVSNRTRGLKKEVL